MTELLEEMKRLKVRVDRVILDDLLPSESSIAEVDSLFRMMRDYPSRPAKGMRPFLCVTTCKAAGGTEEESLLTAACIEMFQNWILIHDDIEDGSELRRGSPALHKLHGAALALNAGDALHARTWSSLLRNTRIIGAQRTLRVMEEFSRMVNETTEGQHMELSWVRGRNWNLGEEDYFAMCTKKTSWYTVASPCRLGAIVAGASNETLGQLLDYGQKLGVAFQIQDDVLNLVGDERYGKANSDDILEGKRTLILLNLLSTASEAERRRVKKIMSKDRSEKTQDEIEYVLSLMEKYGSVEYARSRARAIMDEAVRILKGIDFKGERRAVALLETFSRFAVERQW